MPGITRIQRIENKVKREYPLSYYESQFTQLVHLEWANEWLKTQEAVDEQGAEVCKQKIDANIKKVASIQKELGFIKSQLYTNAFRKIS